MRARPSWTRPNRRRGRRPAVALLLLAALVSSGLATAPPGSAHVHPTRLDLAEAPPAPWRHNTSHTAVETYADGAWVVDSPPGGFAEQLLWFPHGEWSALVLSSRGWAVEARVQVDPATTGPRCDRTNIWAHDLAHLVTFGFSRGAVCITYPEQVAVPFPTTDGFHTYRFEVRGREVAIAADGVELSRTTLAADGDGSRLLGFGDFGGGAGRQLLRWDSFGYEVALGGPVRCTIVGTAGDDTLVGTPGADTICAGRGDDVVAGAGGDDQLIGFLGADRLLGEDGDDRLLGGAGDDVLDGGAGLDVCWGALGADAATGCEAVAEVP